MATLEKEIEKYFKDKLEGLNCLVYKFTSPGNAGVPDRIVVSPQGKVYFIELKRPGGKVRAIQQVQMDRLKDHEAYVAVISNRQEADEFCEQVEEDLLAW